MQTYLSPTIIKKQYDEQLSNEIYSIEQEYKAKEKQLTTPPPQKTSSKMAIILAIIGTLIWPLVGTIAGWFIGKSISKTDVPAPVKISEDVIAARNILRQECDEKIELLKLDYDKQYKAYVDEFEKMVQTKLLDYVDGESSKKIIEKITADFVTTIESASRETYIESVNVPYNFKVFSDKIVYVSDTYTFYENRCQILDSAVNQAALAKTIASAIQLNMATDHDLDNSGSSSRVDIAYDYYDDYVEAKMLYVAKNNNFIEAQSWENK